MSGEEMLKDYSICVTGRRQQIEYPLPIFDGEMSISDTSRVNIASIQGL